MTLDEAVALLRGTTLIQDGTQLGEARALVLAELAARRDGDVGAVITEEWAALLPGGRVDVDRDRNSEEGARALVRAVPGATLLYRKIWRGPWERPQ